MPLATAILAAFALLVAVAPARAQEDAWEALARPGAIAVMRHALAPGTGDPADLTIGDCSTQRNLDERGRAQARAIGAALRERGVAFDRVMTSEWCRCRETAELLDMGAVEALPSLNSFFRDRSTRAEQTESTRAFLRGLDPEARVMLVTHQVNISALTGEFTSSGEIVVGRMGPEGFEVEGSVLIRP